MTSGEYQKHNITIEYSPRQARIEFFNLDLDEHHPTSQAIEVLFEKEPISIVEGKKLGQGTTIIDAESPRMRELRSSAEMLLSLPEEDRLQPLMDMVRSAITYASHDAILSLAETRPEEAEWVRSNASLSKRQVYLPFSQLVEHGWGVCQHFAVLYLWLASKAGLKGVCLPCTSGLLKNIIRTDNGQPLFKTEFEEGNAPGHAWVEIQLSNGQWIPVDPTVNLIGDTDEGMAMFHAANYMAIGSISPSVNVEPAQLLHGKTLSPLSFFPGQKTAPETYALEPTSFISRITDRGLVPGSHDPYRGSGTMTIHAREDSGLIGLTIVNVRGLEPNITQPKKIL